MCVTKEGASPQTPVKAKISANNIEDQVQPPRSPLSKLLFRELPKPKLSRKIVPGSKVNLNKYWSKFGDLLASPSSKNNLCSRLAKLTMEEINPRLDAKKRLTFAEEHSRLEKSTESSSQSEKYRFMIVDNDLNEADDNLANEIREICYSSLKDCKCFH